MCGVVGFWNRDRERASEAILGRMLERIPHRGPDDQGTWTQGPVGLGHARLSILDLSERGHQPFLTADGTGVISYNGEVYNFRELRKNLEKEGIRFTSTTDTEVVLYALHVWGPEKAVSLFNGMFAFAYFDRRSQTLWLSRDKAGIKPLYMSRVSGAIVFGSEIKALFAHPHVPCRVDLHAMTTQLICQRLDGAWTTFEKVECVLPGTLVKLTEEREETIQYFDLLRDVEVDRIVQNRQTSFEDLLRDFEALFDSSVQAHLISDAPLATMSSGGLDSSLMTAVAKKYKSDIVAYVADVKGINVPEAPKAKKVCDHVGIELRPVLVDREEYLRLWPLTVYHNDQPNYFAQNVPFLAVAHAARNDGFKVLLTGEGSDELFGGYPWQADVYKMWRLRRLHSQLFPNIGLFRFLGNFFEKLSPLDLKGLTKRPFDHISRFDFHDNTIREMCAVDGAQRHLRQEALFQKLGAVEPVEERAFLARSFEDFYCHLRILLRCNDKMGMAQSIEARVPFIENGLMDFGLHLPCHSKYHKAVAKRIVKKAAEKWLPHDIVHAPKIGFGVSYHVWKHTAEFLKNGMVADLFKWGGREIESIFKSVFSDHIVPFHLVSMELWARIFLRGESPAELGERLLAISETKELELKAFPQKVVLQE